MRMIWFNVEKVEYPSEEPLPSRIATILVNRVLEEVDIPYYRLFNLQSEVYVYAFSTYFLARQYAYDRHAKTSTLHAEYRLTLTEEALNIVNKLLNAPFKCKVERSYILRDEIFYECKTEHPVPIQDPISGFDYQGRWKATVYIRKGVIDSWLCTFVIPFNCGPLQPLWKRAVECWVNEIARLKAKDIDKIKSELLQHQYLNGEIIPAYYI